MTYKFSDILRMIIPGLYFITLSLGISVDIVRSALENAALVIAQLNNNMPRVHGETFINAETVDYIIPFDELLLENKGSVPDFIAQRIGKYVARIIQDGDTIQVGYGSISLTFIPKKTSVCTRNSSVTASSS